MAKTDVTVPDIGDYENVPVIEGLVKDATIVVVGEDEQRTIDLRLVERGGLN